MNSTATSPTAIDLLRRHATRLGLPTEQLTLALLHYAYQDLADWTEERENNDPGSVWCAGDAPDWLEPHLSRESAF
jgi:hypothetical protein